MCRVAKPSRPMTIGVALVTLLTFALAFVQTPATAATPQINAPPGILEFVPIIIANLQSSPTPIPFQQMLTVVSSSYSTYEAPDLRNVEFFTSTGAIVPSWLESGNSNAAANTTYWLDIASGIPANSNVTVYLGFASPSVNMLNNQTTGEAPQLSTPYGRYDDGRNVFPSLYQDFAGSQCPSGWVCSGVTMNNGVSIPYPSYIVTNQQEYGLDPGQVLDFAGTFPVGNTVENAGFGYTTSSSAVDNDGAVQVWWEVNTLLWPNGQAGGLADDGVYYSYTPSSVTGTHVYSVYWPSQNSASFSGSYGSATTLSTHVYGSPLPVGGANNQQPQVAIGPFYWVRLRAFPPAGVMPRATLGSMNVGMTISCAPAVVGSASMCTATMTGNTLGGTISWTSGGVGTFSPVATCTLLGGNCSVTYTPLSSQSPITITATYQGVSNDVSSAGMISLAVAKASTTTSVSCSPSPAVVGVPTICKVNVAGYSPSGTITWSSDALQNFTPYPTCILFSGACMVEFTPSSASPATIVASYPGDQNNTSSSGRFNLAVGTPTTTSTTSSTATITVTASSTAPEYSTAILVPLLAGILAVVVATLAIVAVLLRRAAKKQ